MNKSATSYAKIPGFPLYEACRDGFVVNVKTGRRLHGGRKKTGYIGLILCDENHKRHYFMEHRIIATAFCKKENGETEVNHKNGVKDDNRAENLEWVTHHENLEHAYNEKLMPNNTTPKVIIATNMKTGEKTVHPSIYKAARDHGISQGNICMCCNGIRRSAGGYFWEYAE